MDGFVNRNDARKYASSMLKAGYIRHTVHKLTFSEQCYYVFGDFYAQGKVFLIERSEKKRHRHVLFD